MVVSLPTKPQQLSSSVAGSISIRLKEAVLLARRIPNKTSPSKMNITCVTFVTRCEFGTIISKWLQKTLRFHLSVFSYQLSSIAYSFVISILYRKIIIFKGRNISLQIRITSFGKRTIHFNLRQQIFYYEFLTVRSVN